MNDPYKSGMIPANLYTERKGIIGSIVAIMNGRLENRQLHLIPQPTRVLKKFDIAELIGTQETVRQGGQVNSIVYLGFFEVAEGGVIKRGDRMMVGNRVIGEVAGYDETHMPNHMNIIIQVIEKKTGKELEIELNESVEFHVSKSF